MGKVKFEELSDREVKEICDLYNTSDVSVTEIIEKYNLDCKPRSFFKLLPPVTVSENCTYCQVPMLANRTRYINPYSTNRKIWCPLCGHSGDSEDFCNCDNCQSKRNERKKYIESMLIKKYGYPEPENVGSAFSPFEMILLSYVSRIITFKRGEEGAFRVQINYYGKYVFGRIIESLLCSHCILIDVNKTPLNAFRVDGDLLTFDYNEMVYRFNFGFDIKKMKHNTLRSYSEEIKKKVLRFLMNASLEANIISLMKKRGFDNSIVKNDVFDRLLNNYSFAQIFFMNYKQAEYALHLKYVNKLSDDQIENSICDNIIDRFEQYEEKGWTVYQSKSYDKYIDGVLEDYIEYFLGEELFILKKPINEITLNHDNDFFEW